LSLHNVVLDDGEDVRLLADAALKGVVQSLDCPTLYSLATTTPDNTKSSGFLDPILNAIVQGGHGCFERLLAARYCLVGLLSDIVDSPIEKPSLASIERLHALVYHFVHTSTLREYQRQLLDLTKMGPRQRTLQIMKPNNCLRYYFLFF